MKTLYESLLDDEEDLINNDVTIADALGLIGMKVVTVGGNASYAKNDLNKISERIIRPFKLSELKKHSKNDSIYKKYLMDGTFKTAWLSNDIKSNLTKITDVVCETLYLTINSKSNQLPAATKRLVIKNAIKDCCKSAWSVGIVGKRRYKTIQIQTLNNEGMSRFGNNCVSGIEISFIDSSNFGYEETNFLFGFSKDIWK